MRSKATIFATLALAALAIAATPGAFAQPPGGNRGMHGPGRDRDGMRGLVEFLGLTDEQREDWTAAHKSHFEGLRPTMEKIGDLREQMRAELESGSPDAATVGGYMISIHQLEAELRSAHADLENALNEILSDEQETKLEAWKAANSGGHHRGPGGPGGPGWGERHHHGRGDGPDDDDGAAPGSDA
jgi:Spy/CpxP family protein refolding chaperone